MAEIAEKIMGLNIEIKTEIQRIRPDNSEVLRLYSDNRLINRLTDIKREYWIDGDLQATVNWFARSKNLKNY